MQQQGDGGFTVSADGVQIEWLNCGAEVVVEARDALVVVDISAMSYADYQLKVTRR